MAMRPRAKFVPLAEMAEKWDYKEDELIQLAIEKEFNLYCLKPIPNISSRMPFFIGDELNDFLPGKPSISCSKFDFKTSDYEEGTFVPVSPEDRIYQYMDSSVISALNPQSIRLPESAPQFVTIERTDLFLHREEIDVFEGKLKKLSGQELEILTASKSKEPEVVSQSDVRNVTPSKNIDVGPTEQQLMKDDAVAVSSSPTDPEVSNTVRNQPPLPEDINDNSRLKSKATNPKTPKKPKKKQSASNTNGELAELPLLRKNDNNLPVQRQSTPVTGYYRLKDIIGDKKAGIPSIIPFSKTTWWEGVKSGRFPPSIKLSKRCTAWKISDIRILQEAMEGNMKFCDYLIFLEAKGKETNDMSTEQPKAGKQEDIDTIAPEPFRN